MIVLLCCQQQLTAAADLYTVDAEAALFERPIPSNPQLYIAA